MAGGTAPDWASIPKYSVAAAAQLAPPPLCSGDGISSELGQQTSRALAASPGAGADAPWQPARSASSRFEGRSTPGNTVVARPSSPQTAPDSTKNTACRESSCSQTDTSGFAGGAGAASVAAASGSGSIATVASDAAGAVAGRDSAGPHPSGSKQGANASAASRPNTTPRG